MKKGSYLYFKRRLKNFISKIFAYLMTSVSLFFLGWLLFSLITYGSSHFNLSLFMETTPPPGMEGGLLNAILGSLMMVGLAVLMGTPIAVVVAVYLTEYGSPGYFASMLKYVNDILLSAPSIILGLFIYQIYVLRYGSFSGWAGVLALSLIVFPIVVRASENVLTLIPDHLKEAAAALGTPKWKTIIFLILPISRTGIVTGAVLAFARVSGETAPLLFTALNNQFMNLDLNKPMASLPVVIFQFAMSPYDDWHKIAWSGALFLTLIVLTLNVCVRLIFRQKIILH